VLVLAAQLHQLLVPALVLQAAARQLEGEPTEVEVELNVHLLQLLVKKLKLLQRHDGLPVLDICIILFLEYASFFGINNIVM